MKVLHLVLVLCSVWSCSLAKVKMTPNLPNSARNKIVYNHQTDRQDDSFNFDQGINPDWPDEQKIIYQLLREYDTAARPVFNATQPISIKFSLSFIQISDMDEKNQVLTSNIWIEQEWLDERLKWDDHQYNYLDKIRIPSERIWLPDTVLYNSAEDYNKGHMQSKTMLKPDGSVFWPLPFKIRSTCKIDVALYPFDDQTCHWKFGMWTYSGNQVDLVNLKDTADMENYIESGEWVLMSIKNERRIEYYACCPEEPFPYIEFTIKMRRRVLHFVYNIILPCVWLSILNLVGFWLPPDSGEKITLGTTVLLAYSVFMLLIAENIPATSETVPLITIYLTAVMSLTSISIVLTVLMSQIHHATPYSPDMSRSFYNFMTRRVATYIGMSNTVMRYENNILKLNQETADQKKTSKVVYLKQQTPSNNESQVRSSGINALYGDNKELSWLRYEISRNTRMLRSLREDMKQLLAQGVVCDTTSSTKAADQWKLIGIILDRILFWLFTLLTFVLSCFLLILLPAMKNNNDVI